MPSSPEWLAKPENQEKMRQARLKWKMKNPTYKREISAEKKAEYAKTHYEKHKPTRIKYLNAHRKGRVKDATPAWADTVAIRHFYVACPDGYHVDHIIPLRGEMVSGLHVLENLQYLPANENLRKSNKCPI